MSDTTHHLSNEEIVELQKIRIRQEMQEEITSWVKKRFAVVGLVVGVLGFFGVSAILHQGLQVLVTERVERELAKLDNAKEKAAEVAAVMSFLSEDAEEKGRRAQDLAEAATKKFGQMEAEIRLKIDELESTTRVASESAVRILDQYAHIRSGMSRVSDELFNLASSMRQEEKLLKIELKKVSEMQSALHSLNTVIATSVRSAPVDSALKSFRFDTDTIEARYISSIDYLSKLRGFNIVYYIRRPEDDELAQAVVHELKSEGYRAAVWYAASGSRNEVIREIAGEFGDIADILQEHPSGIIVDPQHEDVAAEIEQLLSADFKADNLDPDVFIRQLQPIEQHLTYDQGRKSFEADKVILIYAIGPATS